MRYWIFGFLVLLFLLNIQHSLARTCTTYRNGRWNAFYTWSTAVNTACARSGGVPGDGDTATIAHTVTTDMEDITIGTSPSDTTTNVLTISGNGRLSMDGGSITIKGNVDASPSYNTNAYSFMLYSTAKVQMMPVNANYQLKQGTYGVLMARGNSNTSRAVFTSLSTAGGYRASIVRSNPAQLKGSCADVSYAEFTRFGPKSSGAIGVEFYPSNTGCTTTSIVNSYFFDNARIAMGMGSAGSSVALTVSNSDFVQTHANPSGYAHMFYGVLGAASGTVTITKNFFDWPVVFNAPTRFTVTKNYFNDSITTSGLTSGIGSYKSFTSFQENYIKLHEYRSPGVVKLEGRFYNNYWSKDNDQSGQGWYHQYADHYDSEYFDNVIDDTSPAEGSDYFIGASKNGYKVYFKRNIAMPNKLRRSGGTFVHVYPVGVAPCTPTDNYPDSVIDVQNNTYISVASNGDAALEAATAYGHGMLYGYPNVCTAYNQCKSDVISNFKNNLAFTPQEIIDTDPTTAGPLFQRFACEIPDGVRAANADYNWRWNLQSGNTGNPLADGLGYVRWTGYRTTAMFSNNEVPEAHSATNTGNPLLSDWTRNMPAFDRDYLGNTPSAWDVDHGTYNVGDMVAHSEEDNFGGKTLNFRCIKSHDPQVAFDNARPGAGVCACGTAAAGSCPHIDCPGYWRTYWEYASAYRLRTDRSLIPTLLSWVKDGYKPNNISLWTAGENGTWIGAMLPNIAPIMAHVFIP